MASRNESVQPRLLGGILVRRACWTLSRTGKVLLVVVCIALVTFAGCMVHPFLAVTKRAPAEVLLVEGWTPGYVLEQVVEEYRRGGYARVITTGGYTKEGWLTQSNRTYADYSAFWLPRLGIPADMVHSVSCLTQQNDRTYNCAVEVRHYFQSNSIPVKSVNVVTLGPHARRSCLIYQGVFGRQVKVGVISIENREYDPSHWWRSSEGVREVLGETIAYLYSKFFFWPASGAKS